MNFKDYCENLLNESKESRDLMRKMHLVYVGYGVYKDQQGNKYEYDPRIKQMKKLSLDTKVKYSDKVIDKNQGREAKNNKDQVQQSPKISHTMEIKSRLTGEVLYSAETENIKELLISAIKSGANLRGVDLSDVDLSDVDLSGANLIRANLQGANLSRADLYGTDLSGANLYRAVLSGANLTAANLSGAYLTRADLYGTDLSGANLTRVDLTFADLTRADLRGANLTRAKLSSANLYGAKRDKS